MDQTDHIAKVKVVSGDMLAILDKTGTLTKKYQARFEVGTASHELLSAEDTALLTPFVSLEVDLGRVATPVSYPETGQLLPIAEAYRRLTPLIGQSFVDAGIVQERNRGAALHRLVCSSLGYGSYQDAGQFPDVRHQLIEVKLQTSPTIDLGLFSPDSTEPLDVPQIGGEKVRHCDVRYAVFYGQTDGVQVTLTHLAMATGEAFFDRFQQCQGMVLNEKLQIPLPSDFFDD